MAHWMHIRPWEIDLLTVDQFDRAIDAITRAIAASRR